jgi:hypothetical protein
MRGMSPRRLMSSQATSTRANQRAVARSRSAVANRALREGERQMTMATSPSNNTPRPSPSRATPARQSPKMPTPKVTSSLHPRMASATRE